LTIPAKFVWGNQDLRAPLALARRLEALLPNIPFTYIEGAGHQVQTDQPARINQMVIDFFTAS
jgi:pimeloyl-ACP methyl ester carboxylesterase